MSTKKLMDFYKGMDLSLVPQCRDEGAQFKDFDGKPLEALALAKKYGVNAVRLRIWNEPENEPESLGYCNLERTVKMAKEIKENGMDFLLDFHYSDYWADPAKQKKPESWSRLSYEELQEAVYEYTKNTILTLKQAGGMPDMVQIGNEIRSGLLFPDGELPDLKGMVGLVNAGIKGAREAGGEELLVMIHLDQGGRYFYLKEWFDNAIAEGLLDFDVIGLSYYPFWHGTFSDLKNTMEKLVQDYHKPIIIAETAHAWRRSAQGFIDEAQEKIAGIPATPKGQKKVLELVMNITASLPDRMGRGAYYWEPFCIPKKGEGGWAENMGLLSEDGTVLEGIEVFLFTREKQRFQEAAKVYCPEELSAAKGKPPVLPKEVNVLFYDGRIRKHPVFWSEREEKPGGGRMFEGNVEGVSIPVLLTVTEKERDKVGENLLQDPNWDEGFAYWEVEKEEDKVSVWLRPEFVEPFPAPPQNELCLEAVRNFRLCISQKAAVSEPGTYCLCAQYMGTDTTNVDIRMFAEDGSGSEEIVIHPTQEDWQDIILYKAVDRPGTLRVGIRMEAPPVNGKIRCFSLGKKQD